MTANELITRTQQHVNNRPAPSAESSFFIDRVNDGYNWLWAFRNPITRRRIHFLELRDSISRVISANPSTNFVANSTQVHTINDIFDVTNNVWIQHRPFRSFFHRKTTNTGAIREWTPFGSDNVAGFLIDRLPIVDTTLLQYVYKEPEILVVGTTAPVINKLWHRSIHLIAGGIAAEMFDMLDRSSRLFQLASAEIESRVSAETEDNVGGLRTFQVGAHQAPIRSIRG